MSSSKHGAKAQLDQRRVSSDLLALTYGALVTQLLQDFEHVDEVNKQLDKMGYNIGVRLIDDFLARNPTSRCGDLKEVADVIAEGGFKVFLGAKARVSNWSNRGDAFSLTIDHNPLSEFIELPPDKLDLAYSNMICGAIRGALQSVQLDCRVFFEKDHLRGDDVTQIRVEFVQRLTDQLPAGDS